MYLDLVHLAGTIMMMIAIHELIGGSVPPNIPPFRIISKGRGNA